ncbi:MAG: type I restriction endonuclease subunit R [Coleofasciculus sp. C1-SOL-03]|jgi:hypothetical protein|uniref:type I restriction endonuclease subunit R n=1 Tax=Coleofasciculus sp. C1-SOL-03 TaxID=3069522 RepID=UPI0032FCF4C0
MVTKLAVTDVVKSLNQAESRFNLIREIDLQFFPEWFENLPELTAQETAMLDRVRRIHAYHRADGPLTEGTVNLLILSPLLYLAGFCEPPFKIRAEVSVEITHQQRDEILRGRIDALVLQNLFWLVFVESKPSTFACLDAIPQALAYMMANPVSQQPAFGLVTNGDDFIFVKLVKQSSRYALSTNLSLLEVPDNGLYRVLRVMKRIGEQIGVAE